MVEPGCNLAQAADAVFWLAAAAELMVFSMEQAHSGRNTVHPQSGEHLDSIGHPAAVVLIRLDKEGRRLAAACIFERRALPHLPAGRLHFSGAGGQPFPVPASSYRANNRDR